MITSVPDGFGIRHRVMATTMTSTKQFGRLLVVLVVVSSSSLSSFGNNGFFVSFCFCIFGVLNFSFFARFELMPPFRANSSRSARPTRVLFSSSSISSSSGFALSFLDDIFVQLFVVFVERLTLFHGFRGLFYGRSNGQGCSKSSAYSSQSKSNSSRHFFINGHIFVVEFFLRGWFAHLFFR